MSEQAVKPERGDVVAVEYTVREKATSRVVDTTSEEVAKEHGIYKDGAAYGPRLVILGAGEIPPGLEEALLDMREGEEREVEVPPEKAFGVRDPEKVRVIPARELSARGIVPRAGMEVEVRGEWGTVISVGGGRVIIDFNHPLAGKELVYRVKLAKVYKSPEEKVKALFEKHVASVEASLNLSNGDLIVTVPFQALSSPETLSAISDFARDVERYVSEVKAVRLSVTVFERKEAANQP